jgi:hypothetical protein
MEKTGTRPLFPSCGAGTGFYNAVDFLQSKALEQRFLDTIFSQQGTETRYKVVHDYISCIAGKGYTPQRHVSWGLAGIRRSITPKDSRLRLV